MSDTLHAKTPKMTMKPSVTSNTFNHTMRYVDKTTFHAHVIAVTLTTDKKPNVAGVAYIRRYVRHPRFP